MKNFKKNIILLMIALLFSFGVEWVGGLLTRQSLLTWYTALKKPAWNPPNFVFPIVWTTLFGMIGVSFWLILRHPKAYQFKVFLVFFLQMSLNMLWSYTFFYLQQPGLACIVIFLLLCAIYWNIHVFYVYSKLAGQLLFPYLIWVIYAMTLNVSIWLNN